MSSRLPDHLKKYIVSQNYEKYTPVDQACWRYILRRLKSFLSTHAHECYLEGLEKTGIEIDHIPRIEDISKKLEKFGWRALPVSGFIPPAAFMELQSLGVLPIASDMRTLEHLSYTPAPDIVHEAAGHAPILVNPDFARYLRDYAQVAKMAIISKEDLDLYEAIRELSDIKECPTSTLAEIQAAQEKLELTSKKISHVSEASELSRMNWWTAEYGLIGDLENPKIFGAGLLSSLGESHSCLSPKVKKIPLSLACLKQTYDITEPQPQLFVTPDFQTLSRVLQEMAEQMAFKTGGTLGLKKAVAAKTVNTAELNTGLQISGCISDFIENQQQVIYLKSSGATQLSYQNHQLRNHSTQRHSQGFSTVLGSLISHPDKCLSSYTSADLQAAGLELNSHCSLVYTNGVRLTGTLKDILRVDGKILLLTFINCSVRYNDQILFTPAWGDFDLAVGQKVTSVFAGPADRISYGGLESFSINRVAQPTYSDKQKDLHLVYQRIRDLRELSAKNQQPSGQDLENLYKKIQLDFPFEWLGVLELYELSVNIKDCPNLTAKLHAHLNDLAAEKPNLTELIQAGLEL